jgi:hypothetical protein
LALLTGLPLPLPLLAVQLLWLNLVTNGIQDVALAFEPAEGDELRNPLLLFGTAAAQLVHIGAMYTPMKKLPIFPQFRIDSRLIRIQLLDIFDLMNTLTSLQRSLRQCFPKYFCGAGLL